VIQCLGSFEELSIAWCSAGCQTWYIHLLGIKLGTLLHMIEIGDLLDTMFRAALLALLRHWASNFAGGIKLSASLSIGRAWCCSQHQLGVGITGIVLGASLSIKLLCDLLFTVGGGCVQS
jgi:hypothetical protein